eukprot:jgi/Ulvmu1/10901/UM007_0078.1
MSATACNKAAFISGRKPCSARRVQVNVSHHDRTLHEVAADQPLSRREAAIRTLAVCASLASAQALAPANGLAADGKDFVTLPSGLKVLDIREGTGGTPSDGDTVEVHWSGYTAGYQGKRIDNTSVRDEPYRFQVGSGQAITAFDEAVRGMRAGGVRRIEVPGEVPELGYARDRRARFTDDLVSADLKVYRYRRGPQPAELGGQRALDFVLDNPTLRDFNRNLVFDIKLLAIRSAR